MHRWFQGQSTPFRLKSFARLMAVFLSAVFLTAFQTADSGEPPASLQVGIRISKTIRGGQTHRYELTLARNDFVLIRTGQKAADVTLSFAGPGLQSPVLADSPTEDWGEEPLVAIAPSAGRYQLAVSVRAKDAPEGSYELVLAEVRPSRAEDSRRVEAQRLMYEGMQLQGQQTSEGVRSALTSYRGALEIWRALDDRRRMPVGILAIAQVQELMDEWKSAVKGYEEALEGFREIGDVRNQGLVLANLGAANERLDNPEAAKSFTEAALPLLEKAGDRRGAAFIHNNLGYMEAEHGESQKALAHHHYALELFRAVGEKGGESQSLNNLGATYFALGEPKRALRYHLEAMQLRHALGDRRGEGLSLHNLGSTEERLGNLPAAMDYFRQAIQLRSEAGDQSGWAGSVLELGLVQCDLKQESDCRQSLETALDGYKKISDVTGQAMASMRLGSLDMKQARLADARQRFDAAYELLRAVQSPGRQVLLLVEMARLELKSGNFAPGKSRISEASALVEKLRSTAGTPASRASYLESARTVHETQVELLMEWDHKEPNQGHIEDAFAAAERARSRVLLESIPEAQSLARENVDPKLAAQRASMQRKLRRMTDAMSRLPPNSAARPGQGDAELDRIREQIEQLEAQMQAVNTRYRDLSRTEPLTLVEIREQVLDSNTVLIAYFLGNHKSYAWLISQTGIRGAALPARAEIDVLAKTVYDELSDPKKGRNRNASVKESDVLRSLVLGPFQKDLDTKANEEGKRLLLVLDGGLQFVPFQALLARQETPLLRGHEIVVLPSASVLAALRRTNSQRKRAPKTIAMFADPVFAPDETRVLQRRGQSQAAATRGAAADPLSPLELDRTAEEAELTRSGESIQRLKFAAQEANGILALVPAGQRLRAMDFDANLRAATDAALAQYRILHYATHGIVNSENPELSGLVLSLVDANGRKREGFLRLPDIYQMRLNADLVVLSACQTALGRVVRSEGLVGLTRGFFHAGATRVVSSLWKVDDEATAELMLRFYRNMLGGSHLRPAAALRAAQLSLAAEERWHDPYYWAGFILQGEWR